MAPGSSVNAILSGSWGDQPTSIFPTLLARAVISGGACPVARLDRGIVVPMRVRFTGASLTNVPRTAGSTNGKAAPFSVNQIGGSVVTALAARTYGHDEFGFALLTTRRAGNGAVTGFDAAVYKASSTLAGHCAITLRPSRNIACDF